MDLKPGSAPEDLMAKFIECLALLPNLKTLEVFSTVRAGVPPGGFGQKSTWSRAIRELTIDGTTMELVGRCPNVESVTVRRMLSSGGATLLGSYGKGLKKLKRIVKVHVSAVKQGKLGDILVEDTRSLIIDDTSRKLRKTFRTSKKFATRVQLGPSLRMM